MQNCSTEYGVVCARELCVQAKKVNAARQLGATELKKAMMKGEFFRNILHSDSLLLLHLLNEVVHDSICLQII